MNDEIIDKFVIKNPKWQFITFIILTVIAVAVCVTVSICLLFKVITTTNFVIILSIFSFLLLIGLFGIYVCVKEKFIFENEEFTYVKVFKKSQSIKIENLDKVVIDCSFILSVKMYDKLGNVALNFIDDGTAFKNGLFIQVLKHRNILLIDNREEYPWWWWIF